VRVASILISGIVTTVLVSGVDWIDRRRHASGEIVAEPERTRPRRWASPVAPVRVAMKGR
jgi:hypothetical protein